MKENEEEEKIPIPALYSNPNLERELEKDIRDLANPPPIEPMKAGRMIISVGSEEIEYIFDPSLYEQQALAWCLEKIRRYASYMFVRLENERGLRTIVSSSIKWHETPQGLLPVLEIKIDGYKFVGKALKIRKRRKSEKEISEKVMKKILSEMGVE
ncbi:MAG: hypothetical protein DRP01_02575 [Archaeoglobales archaeon]|nr:MAG: hypothetical protein DRP01_02575 [Archaeoglobales archaeon]